jgi:hypothetical protein
MKQTIALTLRFMVKCLTSQSGKLHIFEAGVNFSLYPVKICCPTKKGGTKGSGGKKLKVFSF